MKAATPSIDVRSALRAPVLLLAAALALAVPAAHAQAAAVAAVDKQDASAGQQLALQGAPGAAACSGCHGAQGEGNPQSGFPRLAALGQAYLAHQLDSYADGTRSNAVMTPIAKALQPQQRHAAAAYYASLGAAATAARPPSGAAPALAVRGDANKRIQGCANCHGPQGIGDAAANPYLAGQNAAYLASALAEWKSGARRNDPSGQMPAIAKALTDADVKTLVAYFSALPPPAPGNAQASMVASAPGRSRADVQSGPVAPTAPHQGVGVEQGAPLTGGSQGQGSGGAGTNPAQSGSTTKP